MLEETCLEKYMENVDIVITGEGRLDGQTAMGKAPVGVARLAKNMIFLSLLSQEALQKKQLHVIRTESMPSSRFSEGW